MTYLYGWWPASRRRATLLALACCVIASLILGACSSNQTTPSCTSCAPPVDWELQQGQLVATGVAGTFALKWVEVTPQQVRFYYVFLSTQHDQLQATASVSYPTNTSVMSSPPTTVQVLGQIGDYAVGSSHVDWPRTCTAHRLAAHRCASQRSARRYLAPDTARATPPGPAISSRLRRDDLWCSCKCWWPARSRLGGSAVWSVRGELCEDHASRTTGS